MLLPKYALDTWQTGDAGELRAGGQTQGCKPNCDVLTKFGNDPRMEAMVAMMCKDSLCTQEYHRFVNVKLILCCIYSFNATVTYTHYL